MKGGKLRALAISSAKRFAAAPDIPTVAESGLPGFETGSFQGIVAPAGTPPEIVNKLHDTVTEDSRHAGDAANAWSTAGAETRPESPAQFGTFIRDEKARWAKVVKDLRRDLRVVVPRARPRKWRRGYSTLPMRFTTSAILLRIGVDVALELRACRGTGSDCRPSPSPA